MNSTSFPRFEYTTLSLVGSLLIVLATAILGWLAYRASGSRRSVGWLELFRLGLVTLGALLFNQPEWIERSLPRQKPAVVVLVDHTAFKHLGPDDLAGKLVFDTRGMLRR